MVGKFATNGVGEMVGRKTVPPDVPATLLRATLFRATPLRATPTPEGDSCFLLKH